MNPSSIRSLGALVALASLAAAQEPTVADGPSSGILDRTQALLAGAARSAEEAARPSVGRAGDVTPDGAVFAPRAPRTFRNEAPRTAPVSDEDLASRVAPAFDLAPDRSRLHFDLQDGVHWVRGRSFKARAAADGFTYVPFLGSDASKNWPVRFRLASATIGGAGLALDAGAKVRLSGSEFLLDRGPIDVEYEVGLDGVEQLFHIEREGLSGEIVVTVDVETELSGAPLGGGLRFDGPEGGVDYGAAVAFDGAGATVEVPVQYEAGTLQLTVPASFVDAAAGDITIDPLLTSFTVDTVDGFQSDIDTGYTSNRDAFLFVYEDRFSGSDRDVYLTVIDTGGTFVDGRYVEVGDADWVDPEVAQLSGDDVALVVATQTDFIVDDPIQGRLYDTAVNDFVGPGFEIAGTGGSSSLTWTNANADVGGSRSTASGERFYVCWERTLSTGGTFARYVTVSAQGGLGPIRAMGPTAPASDVSDVRVSESAGDVSNVNVWCVCFKNAPAGSQQEIWAGQYNPDGTVASDVAVVQTGATLSAADLDVSDGLVVDGLEPAYVIVYTQFIGGIEVVGLVCRDSTLVGVSNVNRREHAVSSVRDQPRIATTIDRFVVGYLEDFGIVGVTYVTSLDLVEGTQLAVAERRLELPQINRNNIQSLGIASRASAGVFSRWVGLGYEFLDSSGVDQDVTAAIVSAETFPSPAFQYCEGTVNSTGDRGFIRLQGTRSATSIKTAFGEALPPGQFCLLLAGPAFDNVPVIGGGEGTLCIGGSLGRYNDQINAVDASGVVSFTIDPAVIPAGGSVFTATPGDFYQFQIWHRDVAGAGPTSNLTNAVTILFD